MNGRDIIKSQLDEYNRKNLIDQYIAESDIMLDALDFANKLSSFHSNVLILGESGVGKEALAKYIHCQSSRSKGPFMAINCSAIPGNLFESEIFGYEKGSFTGADAARAGLLEAAQGGTVFLDEIGELPLEQQPKFLRFLETRNIIRIGGNKVISSDARIICATNSNIHQKIINNEFREDLYYRISTAEIHIPPLRERPADIMPLCEFFLAKLNRQYNCCKYFTQDAVDALCARFWKGNAREIRNVIERMMINSTSDAMSSKDINWQRHATCSSEDKCSVTVSGLFPLKDATEALEKQLLRLAVNRKMSTREIAKVLKIDQSTVVRKLRRYNL